MLLLGHATRLARATNNDTLLKECWLLFPHSLLCTWWLRCQVPIYSGDGPVMMLNMVADGAPIGNGAWPAGRNLLSQGWSCCILRCKYAAGHRISKNSPTLIVADPKSKLASLRNLSYIYYGCACCALHGVDRQSGHVPQPQSPVSRSFRGVGTQASLIAIANSRLSSPRSGLTRVRTVGWADCLNGPHCGISLMERVKECICCTPINRIYSSRAYVICGLQTKGKKK